MPSTAKIDNANFITEFVIAYCFCPSQSQKKEEGGREGPFPISPQAKLSHCPSSEIISRHRRELISAQQKFSLSPPSAAPAADIVAAVRCDIVHASRGFRPAHAGFRFRGDPGLLFPIGWVNHIPCSIGNEIQPAAGRNPVAARSKSSLRSDEICALRPQTKKPAILSDCVLHLPWQLSTLAGPVVRLPSTC